MREATTEELAYIAGIVDGEGSIGAHSRSIKHPYNFAVRLQVIMTTSQAVSLCYEIFGGTLNTERRVTVTGKPIYRWSIYCRNAAEVLKILIPYLRIKKSVAEDCVVLTEFYRQGKKITQEKRVERIQIVNRILSYTRKGSAVVAGSS